MGKHWTALLEATLKETNTDTIIDLCSGAGGGLIWLNQALKKKFPTLKIVMTDYFPHFAAFKNTKKMAENFDYAPYPVDARNVPGELKGLRTQFLSFHHFKPHDAQLILQHSVHSKSHIAIIEAQERSFPSILAMLISPVTVWLTTPFIRPFKLGRIVFTYLIPVVPLVVLWDGIVSSLRTYSVKEMNKLILQLKDTEKYNWQVGKIKSGPSKLLYLIGIEKNKGRDQIILI